jgi:MSHA biogenesis protein MshO
MMTRLLRTRPRRHAGVTLIELVITIALVGILGALIVQFIAPIRSYVDTSRRAALADTADTALRRIGRDLRLALPNSVRVGGGGKYVEFLLVRDGGRYLAELGAVATGTCNDGAGTTAANDILVFGAVDRCFASLTRLPKYADISTAGTRGDYLVVFNLPPGEVLEADAYQSVASGRNRTKISAKFTDANHDRIQFDDTPGPGHNFTHESPGNRFFIVEGPVSYGCAGGTLTRYWDYDITSTQGTPPSTSPPPPVGAKSAVIATGVNCTLTNFTYDASITAQGAGLVTMHLHLTAPISGGGSDSVSLYHAVHVNNVP